MKKFGLVTKTIIIALIAIFASTYFLDDLRLANVFAVSEEEEKFDINKSTVDTYNFDRYSASMLEEATNEITDYSDTPMIYAFNHGYTGNPGMFTDIEHNTEKFTPEQIAELQKDTIVSKLQAETKADVYYAEM
jgi:hypothetical protein